MPGGTRAALCDRQPNGLHVGCRRVAHPVTRDVGSHAKTNERAVPVELDREFGEPKQLSIRARGGKDERKSNGAVERLEKAVVVRERRWRFSLRREFVAECACDPCAQRR